MKAFPDGVYSNRISCDYIITASVVLGVYGRMIDRFIKVDMAHKIEANKLKRVRQNQKRGNTARKSNVY